MEQEIFMGKVFTMPRGLANRVENELLEMAVGRGQILPPALRDLLEEFLYEENYITEISGKEGYPDNALL
jgi:hypothetical protein